MLTCRKDRFDGSSICVSVDKVGDVNGGGSEWDVISGELEQDFGISEVGLGIAKLCLPGDDTECGWDGFGQTSHMSIPTKLDAGNSVA